VNAKAVVLAGLLGVLAYLTLTKQGRDVAEKIGVAIMDFSNSGLNLVRQFEGFSATPYRDADGWSIGYGHFILPGETYTVIDEAQADALLRADVAKAEQIVRSHVTVPLTQSQFDALVSFVYNVGGPPRYQFENSTLLRLLNAGDYSAAAEQFKRWNSPKSPPQVVAVLTDRRAQERELFMSA